MRSLTVIYWLGWIMLSMGMGGKSVSRRRWERGLMPVVAGGFQGRWSKLIKIGASAMLLTLGTQALEAESH